MMQVVALGLLPWVPVWDLVDHDGAPALFGAFGVVAAGNCHGVEVGSATRGPVGGVVDFGLGGGAGAAGERATAVAGEECFALVGVRQVCGLGCRPTLR